MYRVSFAQRRQDAKIAMMFSFFSAVFAVLREVSLVLKRIPVFVGCIIPLAKTPSSQRIIHEKKKVFFASWRLCAKSIFSVPAP